ncbi:hypothetical protein A4X13_0g1990 [Tilletia indica]|uniref:AAA+ ATPase domain-containing protein n=1 Tax=Tilletia indica TaxID=43049 RepID=A0A177TRS3_9BASI|nr:hypothetical protein A4X13_0g1990 [Tilletia indica]
MSDSNDTKTPGPSSPSPSTPSNEPNTAAVIQQLAQRWGYVASLANPLAGLALSSIGNAAAASASGNLPSAKPSSGGEGEEGGKEVSAANPSAVVQALATSSPIGGIAQTVLSLLGGMSGGASGKNLTSSIRLLVLGFLIAYARSLYDNASVLFRRFFVTTVELSRDHAGPSWYWIEHLFRKVDLGKRLNTFTVESHSVGEDEAIARGQEVPLILGLPQECSLGFFLNARTGRIYPGFLDALKLRNRNGGKMGRFVRRLRLAVMRVIPFTPHAITYAWLESHKETARTVYSSDTMVSQISTVSRSRFPLEALLKHARFVHAREHTSKTRVYVSDPIEREWDLVTTRPKRLFSSVLLEGRTQEALLQDIRSFLSRRMRQFYAQRGVPHRRGYLLYGPPGSGKTSSIVAIAGELNLNLYSVSLAQKGMDERLLLELANNCETPCILLLEDIDAAFTGRTKVGGGGGGGKEEESTAKSIQGQGPAAPPSAAPGTSSSSTVGQENRVTFSALLQLLDGAASSENRIVFATTNHIERLDPALIRPGRIDVRVQYRNASRRQAKGLFLRIFTTLSAQELDEALIEARRAWEETKLHHPAEVLEEDGGLAKKTTTGGGGGVPTNSDLEDEIFHRELVQLGKEFAAQIPERTLSMAQLQGFLIKRAMTAQQDARIRGDHQEEKEEVVEEKEKEKDDDGIVLGVKAEGDSQELKDMLDAARRAVRDIGAFVESGGVDDDEVGMSL